MLTPTAIYRFVRGSGRGGFRRTCPSALLRFALLLSPLMVVSAALAQGPPASPVGYTEVLEHEVQSVLRLSGSVESKTVSLVATEVDGVVVELLAREGDVVRKGQVLASLRTTSRDIQLRASEAQLKEAKSRRMLAEKNLERAQELFEQKVSSQEQLDSAFYEHNAWQGRVEQIYADIERIQHDLDRSKIQAPFAGTIVEEHTEVGEWVSLGAPVLEMVSLAELEIRIEVPERYFETLNPGAAALVTFDSLPEYEINGRISAIIPRADPRARTFPVKVRIPNEEGRVGVGMLAQVTLPAGGAYRATVVPKDAVVNQGPEKIVYLINGDNTVSPVSVETGAGVGSWLAVLGDLKAGQKVVTRGNERLSPGQQVQGEPTEHSPP